MKKNILLERNRFRKLVEYTFYEADVPEDELKLDEADEDTSDETSFEDSEGVEFDEPLDDSNTADSNDEPSNDSEDVDLSGDMPEDTPEDAPDDNTPPTEPLMGDTEQMDNSEDEVELDVSDLVNNTNDAKNSADMANKQLVDLITKFDSLTQGLSKMTDISAKIDALEKEIAVRNPTEVEKLEMRSLNSYPYNLKLTDYWSDKEGAYNVMDRPEGIPNEKPTEFVLTQDDVDSDYNQSTIKNSFDYEEDDIEDTDF